MSNIAQLGGSTPSPSSRVRRRIFTSPSTLVVPDSTTLVEAHVWGGGGGSPTPAGGGGGGYATGQYVVTGGETFSITVGGLGGTSSVTCPSLSPNRPLSATGGSPATAGNSSNWTGGSGGTGAADPLLQERYTASGGTGGPASGGYIGNGVNAPDTIGGGGAAGSLLGTGGNGQGTAPPTDSAGGGGIGGTRGVSGSGGSPALKYGFQDPSWFFVNEIGGFSADVGITTTSDRKYIYSGAGAGGSGGAVNESGGFLGGGGGTGAGGLAGGMGGGGPNSVADGSGGCVIIYF